MHCMLLCAGRRENKAADQVISTVINLLLGIFIFRKQCHEVHQGTGLVR